MVSVAFYVPERLRYFMIVKLFIRLNFSRISQLNGERDYVGWIHTYASFYVRKSDQKSQIRRDINNGCILYNQTMCIRYAGNRLIRFIIQFNSFLMLTTALGTLTFGPFGMQVYYVQRVRESFESFDAWSLRLKRRAIDVKYAVADPGGMHPPHQPS